MRRGWRFPSQLVSTLLPLLSWLSQPATLRPVTPPAIFPPISHVVGRNNHVSPDYMAQQTFIPPFPHLVRPDPPFNVLELAPRYSSPSFQACTPFSGLVDDPIEDFLREYEDLPNSCRLTDHHKVETFTRYTTPDLRDFLKSLDGYVSSGWMDLKRELLKLFADTSALRRHSEQKIQASLESLPSHA